MAIDDRYRTQPFGEALEFLRGKINLDTESWRDISGDEADAFFTVAGAKGSLLSELRVAVDDAIERGVRPEEFQQTFERIAEGWDYNGDAAWRSRIIYQTNLRAAYGRGRDEYQQDPAVQRLQPYLQYQHSDSRAPRPNHIALDGVVFRADQVPWALPAGYGCGCRYISLSQRQLDAQGLAVSSLKKGDTVQVNMPDGRTVTTTLRPDEGWDRQPGQARGARRQELIQRVIDRSPPEIAQQIRAAVDGFEPQAKAPLAVSDVVREDPRQILSEEEIRRNPSMRLRGDDYLFRISAGNVDGSDTVVRVTISKYSFDQAYSVNFDVNGEYSATNEVRKEASTLIANQVRRVFEQHLQGVKNGTKFETAAVTSDTRGAFREAQYARFGFSFGDGATSPTIGTGVDDTAGGTQYGVVKDGKLIPTDDNFKRFNKAQLAEYRSAIRQAMREAIQEARRQQ
ncbi:MAG: hypothetical protein KME14_20395 [Tildeniella torsiva UHER 1998/13D]|jgi:hypothetical protein|nr:hypothetical protein [Tildeniella torsiva UHER 1998/13D]